jgi:effector-binding domain-containing protein
MIYDVDIATVPEQGVIALRARGPITEIGARMARLRALAGEAGLTPDGPMMGRFYEADVDSATLDYEVCLPIRLRDDGSVPDAVGEARGELVPAHHAFVTTHVGRRDAMDDAVAALREALDAVGYQAAGPLTEVYVTPGGASSDPSQQVTEVRLPYAR